MLRDVWATWLRPVSRLHGSVRATRKVGAVVDDATGRGKPGGGARAGRSLRRGHAGCAQTEDDPKLPFKRRNVKDSPPRRQSRFSCEFLFLEPGLSRRRV